MSRHWRVAVLDVMATQPCLRWSVFRPLCSLCWKGGAWARNLNFLTAGSSVNRSGVFVSYGWRNIHQYCQITRFDLLRQPATTDRTSHHIAVVTASLNKWITYQRRSGMNSLKNTKTFPENERCWVAYVCFLVSSVNHYKESMSSPTRNSDRCPNQLRV